VSVLGAEFNPGPEAIVYYPATANVGQNVTFDASQSVDIGFIVSYEWSFGDGTNGTGAIVSHSYNKEGTYQVELNLTNNEGVSSLKTFTITIGSSLEGILLLLKVILAAMLVALISIFAFLLRKRRASRPPASENQRARVIGNSRSDGFTASMTNHDGIADLTSKQESSTT
jgi:PKD repeat protein